ncbi:MAG: hypothetical protein JJU34_11510 [Lunatimonas sp.]|uniref:hypothetical protein n=1 Tax=Lunatimonas sp. TaxID=2060141 RepID=UPI00263B1B5A|nr:hypothetical protein [Lunatimonas sp.]MCC5937898.1 hypothetical protein [Lunatimonas sp.]
MKDRIKKYLIILLAAAWGVGCDTDEGIRLQTDQSFEGEEMYMVSKLLDEHLPFVLQRQTFFVGDDPTKLLPDCPTITIHDQTGDVELVFSQQAACETSSNKRRGKISIHYSKAPLAIGDSVVISFDNYSFENHQVVGTRKFRLVGLNRERRFFEEFTQDLLITTPQNHSTRIHVGYMYELLETGGRIFKITGNGTAQGRNRGGRNFEAEILENKIYDSNCLNQPLLRPTSGVESWVIGRTSTRNINHRQTFHDEGGCTTHTLIRLDEGVEMKKTP